jgi:hypothetical protein
MSLRHGEGHGARVARGLSTAVRTPVLEVSKRCPLRVQGVQKPPEERRGNGSQPSTVARSSVAVTPCSQPASASAVAERSGFEPEVGFDPHTALAMRRFRPLSHLSAVQF